MLGPLGWREAGECLHGSKVGKCCTRCASKGKKWHRQAVRMGWTTFQIRKAFLRKDGLDLWLIQNWQEVRGVKFDSKMSSFGGRVEGDCCSLRQGKREGGTGLEGERKFPDCTSFGHLPEVPGGDINISINDMNLKLGREDGTRDKSLGTIRMYMRSLWAEE